MPEEGQGGSCSPCPLLRWGGGEGAKGTKGTKGTKDAKGQEVLCSSLYFYFVGNPYLPPNVLSKSEEMHIYIAITI